MTSYNLNSIYKQLLDIISGRPIDLEPVDSAKLADNAKLEENIQNVILYLGQCIKEQKEFIGKLSVGELDIIPPSRNNFLMGELKELHSGLKHLTWQASQVAKGEYQQRVDFLGEFSKAFNCMIQQLEERENSLKTKANALSQSMNLLEAIVDGLSEWLIVVDDNTKDIIYLNSSAKQELVFLQPEPPECAKECKILDRLLESDDKGMNKCFELYCIQKNKILSVKSFHIEWQGKNACAHLVSDITQAKNIENIAYLDKLTGLNNRWSAMNFLRDMLNGKKNFLLCYIDIDNLKPVNDQLGHKYGDEYILQIVECLKNMHQENDKICRIGGDEFLYITDNIDINYMKNKLEEARDNLINMESKYTMSFSYGVICIDESNDMTTEQILDYADKKMYLYKQKYKKQCKKNPLNNKNHETT